MANARMKKPGLGVLDELIHHATETPLQEKPTVNSTLTSDAKDSSDSVNFSETK